MSYTPEPWQVGETGADDEGYPEIVITGMDGKASIAVALDFGKNNPLMGQANARRIVACVNACGGFSADELQLFGLGSAIGTEIYTLRTQRDELLAAIKQSLDSIAAIIVDLADVQGVKLTKESVIKKSTNDSPVGVIRELISKIEGK